MLPHHALRQICRNYFGLGSLTKTARALGLKPSAMHHYVGEHRKIPPALWIRLANLLPILESEHKRYAAKRRAGLERRLTFLWERKVASARAAASMAVELRKGAKSLPEDDAMLIQQKRSKTP